MAAGRLRLLQSGQVGTYVLLMVIGMLILFVIQLFIENKLILDVLKYINIIT